jgi:hypothetical protein
MYKDIFSQQAVKVRKSMDKREETSGKLLEKVREIVIYLFMVIFVIVET